MALSKIIKEYKKAVVESGIIKGLSKTTLRYTGSIIKRFQYVVGQYFINPKKNRVAFMSLPDYSDNSKVLSDYVLNCSDYEVFWFVNNPSDIRKKYPDTNIKFYSNLEKNNHFPWKSMLALYSCKTVFYTHACMITKKNCNSHQQLINLWHGCGYKDSERKVPKMLNSQFDYMLVPGDVFVDIKAKFFTARSETIIPIGYPRYDLLNKHNDESFFYINTLKKDAKKLIIWMPTFRKTGTSLYPEENINRGYDLPLLSSDIELEALNNLCADKKIMMCIKRHPFQQKYNFESKQYSNICFISNNTIEERKIDLYTLFQYTDGLISDYSSVAIDYLLLNKPLAFALDDFDQYKQARGFVFSEPLNYMPGYHLYSYKDLVSFINDIAEDIDLYSKTRCELMTKVHNPCNNYCERIWGFVKKLNN